MAITSITQKDEFRNTSDGWLGVVELDHLGRPRGASVEPNGSCFLSEEEQILTANAPREDADNPFVNGTLKLVRSGLEIKNRRRYGDVAGTEELTAPTETGATPTPVEEPALGSVDPNEEVATPTAARARRKR